MALQFAFDSDAGETPETAAQKRRLADMLLGRMGRAQNVGQGIGDILAGIGAGISRYRADRGDAAGNASAAADRGGFGDAFVNMLKGGSQAPRQGGESVSSAPSVGVTPEMFRAPQGLPAPSEAVQPHAQTVPPSMPAAPAQIGGADLIRFLSKDKGRSSIDGMQSDYKSRLARFLQDAPGQGISIYSGYRSPEYQAGLFEKAVKKYGSVEAARKWVAPPGKSNHGHGTAADLRYANKAAEKWAHENAAKYGLDFRMGHEPWHIEPLKGWKDIAPAAPPPVQIASNDSQFMPASASPQDVAQSPMQESAPIQQPIQQQPQQVAQIDNDATIRAVQAAQKLLNNPYASDGDKAQAQQVIDMQMKQVMQANDPAYQMQMQGGQLDLQRKQLELQQLINGTPKNALDEEFKRVQIDKMKAEIAQAANPKPNSGEYGMNLVYGKDANGNIVAFQTNKAGGVKQVEMPSGVNFAPQLQYLDTGTGFTPVDKRGGALPNGVEPVTKDVAGEARQKELGDVEGKAIGAAPKDIEAGENALNYLNQIENSPYLERGTGISSYGNSIPGTGGYDFQNLVDQSKSGAFLTAIAQMRGLGSLSNAEGQTATAAVNRMNTATSKEAFLSALGDYKKIVEQGVSRARSKLGVAPAAAQPPAGGLPQGQLNLPQGAIEDLRSDPSPESQAMFDEIFGAGAAKQALGN